MKISAFKCDLNDGERRTKDLNIKLNEAGKSTATIIQVLTA